MTDAIARTVYRKLISKKMLLEWVTAADAEKASRNNLSAFLWLMLPAELLALLSLALTLILKPASFEVTTAFVAVWVLSPFAAYTLSKIRRPERKLISARIFNSLGW